MKKNQEMLLDNFFKNKELWWPNSYGCKIAAVIILPLAMIILLIPYQSWEGDYQCLLISFYLEWMGLAMYLKPYHNYMGDDGKIVRIYDIVKYLPVSYKHIVIYRWKKMMKLCLRMTGIAMACQVLFSFAFLDTVSLGNILAPLLCCFILPVGVTVLINCMNLLIGKVILHR